MDWSWLTGVTALAAYGGFVSALRSTLKDADKTALGKVLDVVVGILMAASVAEYFVPQNAPKMSIVIGLIAGSFGGYLLDAVQALSPKLAEGLIEGILGRFGFTRKPQGEE